MEILESKKLKLPPKETEAFHKFLQKMANRRTVGHVRYGSIDKKQQYMSRLKKEYDTYRLTGNMENLLNIAVYAFLESYAPENKKFHFNPNVDSATRSKFGGERTDGANS